MLVRRLRRRPNIDPTLVLLYVSCFPQVHRKASVTDADPRAVAFVRFTASYITSPRVAPADLPVLLGRQSGRFGPVVMASAPASQGGELPTK